MIDLCLLTEQTSDSSDHQWGRFRTIFDWFHNIIIDLHVFLLPGVIRANEILDRESTPHYWLTVYAQDRGTIPKTTVVEVYIEVEDVNDNIPQTHEPVYYPAVQENSDAGTSVVKVTASDQDATSNNRLTYDITSGNPQGFFNINTATGRWHFSMLHLVGEQVFRNSSVQSR